MNPLLWLFVGGLLGCLASRELGYGARLGVALNVVAGAGGALLAGWLLATSAVDDNVRFGEVGLGGLFAASFGAIILLALVNLIRLRGNP